MLIKAFYSVTAIVALVIAGARPAVAQTPAPAPTPAAAQSASGPSVNLWYVGGTTGVGAVQHASGAFGGEAGARVWHHLDLFIEGGGFRDVVTRRQSDAGAPITAFLASTQGKPSTSSVKVPAMYGLVGARWVFESSRKLRPYVLFEVGGARVERKPTFTLGGADVTSSLAQYGVTLGSDLTGKDSHAAVGGGFGVLLPCHWWYLDAGYRLTSIQTSGQKTNVSRLNIGFGARF